MPFVSFLIPSRRTLLAAALLPLLPLLAACGAEGGQPVRSANALPVPVKVAPAEPLRQPGRYRPRNPLAQALPGLEAVIGANEAELARLFGQPRLEVWEGDARKLQFIGQACVLDVYLYPESAGAAPKATYVDARRASDGQDVDRAACIAALRQAPGQPAR